jgi:hypothetical protein
MVQEVEQHTKKLREKFGVFNHAPFRTHFDPAREREQLHMLLPAYSDDDEGQPSYKRIKFLGGGYKVRTHHHSGQSDRKARVCLYVNCGRVELAFNLMVSTGTIFNSSVYMQQIIMYFTMSLDNMDKYIHS